MSNPYIVGGAMLPHAPQFFTQPETEDKVTIAEVQKVALRIGEGLKAHEAKNVRDLRGDLLARQAF